MFPFKWQIKDGYNIPGIEKHGLKVFSTFACGGGSTMGYKLAGYDVIGANDIDLQMAEVYKLNHKPKHYYLMPINELTEKANNKELPEEFYNLDILDGSPPCSTFSMSGSREKNWKKEKQFREGQAKQVLSDLFFDFIDLTDALKPKVFVAENVKGMLAGNAKAYTAKIIQTFDSIGYSTQLFLVNSATMGVPQKRERVFFIGVRKDLKQPSVKLSFTEKPITFKDVENNVQNVAGKALSEAYARWWRITPKGKSFSYAHPKGSFFNTIKMHPDFVCNTITATSGAKLCHYAIPHEISDECISLIGSYPTDYQLVNNDLKYLVGMSVPPIMIAQIAHQLYVQLFSKLKNI